MNRASSPPTPTTTATTTGTTKRTTTTAGTWPPRKPAPEAKQAALAMLTGRPTQAIPARTLTTSGTLCSVCAEHGHDQSEHTLDRLQTGTPTTPPPAVAVAAILRQHWYPKTRGLTAWRRPTPNSRPQLPPLTGSGTCPNRGYSGLHPDTDPYRPIYCPNCHAPCYPIVALALTHA